MRVVVFRSDKPQLRGTMLLQLVQQLLVRVVLKELGLSEVQVGAMRKETTASNTSWAWKPEAAGDAVANETSFIPVCGHCGRVERLISVVI
jgi:hypothetical protein